MIPLRANSMAHPARRGAPCAPAHRAFTLVELMVASTISALLVVSVVSATRALSSTQRTVDQRITRASEARRAIESIVAALRNVRRDPVLDEPVLVGHQGAQSRDGDRIDLSIITTQRSRSDGSESDQQEVSFYLQRLPQRPLPVLMCRRDHGLDAHPDEGGIASVVAEGIIGLTFEYYDDGRWVPDWPRHRATLPGAVRTVVVAAAADDATLERRPTPLVLSTVVALHTNPPAAPAPPPAAEGPRPPEGLE